MPIDWFAAGATMVAALMTAANIGARVTGWGFVMFSLGSAAWITSSVLSTDPNLSVLVMHSVLLPVNLFGIWRWLGRLARYEDGSARASDHSRRARVPTLFSAGSLIGSTVLGDNGKKYGTVVDAMSKCDDKRMAYLVISEGGVAGAGETLRAVPPEHLRFDKDDVSCDLSEDQWRKLPQIERDHWPEVAPTPLR